MEKLIAELTRLYLPALPPQGMQRHVLGEHTLALSLAGSDGRTRALAIPFRKMADGDGMQHWSLLCEVANALQTQLGLPAPAVSISGADGFGLWLSLERPVPTAVVQQFLDLLHKAYFPAMELVPGAASAQVELPPCLHEVTGKWAAFINPGLGASFADEAGLDMAPPFAGQSSLLESVQSISGAQFDRALKILQQSHGVAAPAAEAAPAATTAGLLLKDATLEDIVRHLHSKGIEPTFRHLVP